MEPIDPNNQDIHPNPIVPQTWNELFQTDSEGQNSPGVVSLAVGNDGRLVANSPSTPPARIVLPRESVEGAEWVFSGAFSVTDADTVAWGSGTLTTEDGHTYSIGAGNTGNMAAKTYIYFDIDVSTTAFQTTTTAGNAVGAGKILIAIAQNATGEAKFMALNDNQYNIDAANIVANSITANELATSIVYAGSIVIDSAGLIRSGQTAYNTGTGWWIGNDGGTPKLSIGVPTGDYFTFDGVNVTGTGSISTQISATTYATITGATTPAPVWINSLGNPVLSDANNADIDHFTGFVSSTTSVFPTHVNSGTGSSASFSLTANAGTNRLLVVQVSIYAPSANGIMPTAVSWNGIAMTILDSDLVASLEMGQLVAYLPIGDSGSNQSNTLAITGGTYDSLNVTYTTINNVNQSTPVGASQQTTGNSANPSATITPTKAPSLILSLYSLFNTSVNPTWNDGQTVYATRNSGTSIAAASVTWNGLVSNAFDVTDSTSARWVCMAMQIIGLTTTVKVRVAGVQGGFTGLTIGATYYVSNTIGTISTTPGATTVLVGKAISATEVLIVHNSE